MSEFRKRPIVVKAFHFTDETKDMVLGYLGPGVEPTREDGEPALRVITIHGEEALVRLGDWIVKEPKSGFFYPIKPDIFEATYEPVHATSAEPVHHDEAHGYHHADGTPIEPAYDRRKPAHTVPLTAQNSGTNNDSGANAGVTDGLESDSADEVVERLKGVAEDEALIDGDPYIAHASRDALALIQSQAEEIERLEAKNENYYHQHYTMAAVHEREVERLKGINKFRQAKVIKFQAQLTEAKEVPLSEGESREANRIYRELNAQEDPYAVDRTVEAIISGRSRHLAKLEGEGCSISTS